MDLNGLRVLVCVAQTHSFTAAARQLELTPSAVSKAISRIETDLGVRLLHRTTRSIDLTPEGANFIDRCRQVLTDIDEAVDALGSNSLAPQGRLRVQVPVGIGRHVVVPALLQFSDSYPDMVIDVEVSDRMADVVLEGLDLVVTIGPPADASLVARRLCSLRYVACASPSYIEAHGEPGTPEDLMRHHCLAYVLPQTRHYRDWVFMRDGQTHVVSPSGKVNVNHAESLLNFAIAGAGIAMLSSFITAAARRSGALRTVLNDYQGIGPDLYLAYPRNRNQSARVRVFADFLEALVRSMD